MSQVTPEHQPGTKWPVFLFILGGGEAGAETKAEEKNSLPSPVLEERGKPSAVQSATVEEPARRRDPEEASSLHGPSGFAAWAMLAGVVAVAAVAALISTHRTRSTKLR